MSDRKMSWLKFWPDDYQGSERVRLMTIAQDWAYFHLILHCARNGSVPACPKRAAALLGKGVVAEDVAVALEAFEPLAGDTSRMAHPRVLRERDAVGKFSEHQKEKAAKRWGKATAMPDACHSNARALAQEAEAEAEAEAYNTKGKKESLNTPETPPAGVASSATDSAPLALVSEPAPTAKPEIGACPHREIARIWNEVAGAHGMPKVMDMTPARETTLRGLWAWFVGSKAEKLDSVRALFERTASSDFLRNGPGRFDWVIAPANRVKILEGNYDNRAGRANGGRR